MTQSELVVAEDDALLKSDISKEILKQLKALDAYGAYDGWSDARIMDPLILTKERKRAIPIIGDPDDITMSRVKCYYNSLATLIEKESGLIAVPVINLSHEGFGRAFVLVGKLIVLDKVLRDVHRFGFPSLEKLDEEASASINKAVALIKSYPEVANL
jgi:probable nitrogen fixation protein